MYGVESDIKMMGIMRASLSDQVKEIEQSFFELLIYIPSVRSIAFH
jgi:hypothetical protein